MNQQEFMKGVCAPTVIGSILSVVSIVGAKSVLQRRQVIMGSIVQLLILYTLCFYGYQKAAWAFLLLPFGFMLALGIFGLGVAVGEK